MFLFRIKPCTLPSHKNASYLDSNYCLDETRHNNIDNGDITQNRGKLFRFSNSSKAPQPPKSVFQYPSEVMSFLRQPYVAFEFSTYTFLISTPVPLGEAHGRVVLGKSLFR